MDWFTSDTHFGHANVIRFCNRPFADVEEMDRELIRRWNARVQPTDTVWFLGDFCFRSAKRAADILGQLNGEIHLIWGNHDRKVLSLDGWASSQPTCEIQIEGERIVLSHYAHRVWNRSHHGAFHLYGHSHGGLDPLGRSLDVGVDCWDYAPVSLAEIKEYLTQIGTIDDFRNHHPKGD